MYNDQKINNTIAYTGDEFLDKLRRGPYVPNPEYNPKTKKGKTQPTHLVDTTPGEIGGGMLANTVRNMSRLRVTNRDMGLSVEDIEKDAELGITPSIYNTEEQLNEARAELQSNWAKAGNALMQAGVGEVVLGSLAGFGNIVDGIASIFTDEYKANPYTEFMEGLKADLENEFKIYQSNPSDSWNVGDFGWWAQNAVSIASTASLLIPAVGWARALSLLGRITRIGRTLGKVTKGISKGIAKATTKGVNGADKFSALRSSVGKAGRINQSIKNGAAIVGQASLSRAGEGYMEAHGVYDQTYEKSLENIQGMIEHDKTNGTKEFEKFLANNPEFRNEDGSVKSPEEIAEEIANKAADKTYWNDWWMLAMDIPQFKAIGSLWGKGASRASKASERIAAKNQKKILAGAKPEELIKDNFVNRQKEFFKYTFSSPMKVAEASQISEGFEEMYQGIQTEKGMEVAAKYFDKELGTRSISSYLSDGHIWEQGFWGMVGGLTFGPMAQGIKKAYDAAEGVYKKKHMTAEQYEKWKLSQDKININQINSISGKVNSFIENMKAIESGKNPFDFKRDEVSGRAIVKDGKVVERELNEEEKVAYKQEAIKRFVDDIAYDAVDNGTLDLISEILESEEFDKHIEQGGFKLSHSDKRISREIAQRLKDVAGFYSTTIADVQGLTEDANPFVSKAVARNISRNALSHIDAIDIENGLREELIGDSKLNSDYETLQTNKLIKLQLMKLQAELAEAKQAKDNNALSDAAYDRTVREVVEKMQNIADLSTTNTHSFNANGDNVADTISAIEKDLNEQNKSIKENNTNTTPPPVDKKLIDEIVANKKDKAYAKSFIPKSEQDYKNVYNDFAISMDAMYNKKIDDDLNSIKNYLLGVNDFDEGVKQLLKGTTSDKKVNEAMGYMNYGYSNLDVNSPRQYASQMALNAQIAKLIEDTKSEREKREKKEKEEKTLSGQTQATTNNTQSGKSSPSTGKQTQNQQQTVSANNQQSNTTNQTNTSNAKTSQPTSTAPTTNPINANIPTEPLPVNGKPEETVVLDSSGENLEKEDTVVLDVDNALAEAESYKSDSLKNKLLATKFINHFRYSNPAKFKEVVDSISNGDIETYDEFIESIANFLIEQGCDENIAKGLAKSSLVSTIASYEALEGKGTFKKLIQQLIDGFGEEEAKKYSITELINGVGLDEVVSKFLEEYCSLVGNVEVDGIKVINLQSLFDYILNHEHIDARQAAMIYNNLGKYIGSNDGKSYIFTGYDTSRNRKTADEFFKALKETKAYTKRNVGNMHAHLIEKDQRDELWHEAMVEVAKGAKTYMKAVKNEEGVITHHDIIVYLEKDDNVIPVRLGMLRAVEANSDLTRFTPNAHYSGFKNTITIDENGNPHLDCDFLFEALINDRDTNPNAKELFDLLAKYRIQFKKIISDLNNRRIDIQTANDLIEDLVTEEMANKIFDNPLIQQLLNSKVYKVYKESEKNSQQRARNILASVSSILFYDYSQEGDPSNEDIDTFATDTKTLNERYESWRQKVHDNYIKTYDITKNSDDANKEIEINSDVPLTPVLNYLENDERVNIAEAGFEVNKYDNEGNENPGYTPLVYVDYSGNLIGEDGTNYGKADTSIAPHSMGFLVNNENGNPLVAYFNDSLELNDTDFAEQVKFELKKIINLQLVRSREDKDVYDEIYNKLLELIGRGGLIRLEDGIDIGRSASGDSIHIRKNGKSLITFYKNISHNLANSHTIVLNLGNPENTIYVEKSLSNNSGGVLKGRRKNNNEEISHDVVKEEMNKVIDELTKSIKLNKSSKAMLGSSREGLRHFVKRDNGKFTITIGKKTFNCENYGDFLLQVNGFNTRIKSDKNGNFVHYFIDYKLTINADIKSKELVPNKQNTDVSDLLYSNPNQKRKTVDTQDVLKAAGVEQEKIDVLLGKVSGIPIVSKRIVAVKEENDANAFFDKDTKTINITPKGAASMNNNPTNALRLILHENLHRLFHKKGIYNDKERNRIVQELKEVYQYTRDQIEKDRASGKISQILYDQMTSVLDKTASYSSEQVQMEEFLVECLTQPVLSDYLNNTQYHYEAIVEGIPKKAKNIFQKIVDIILDLLGLKFDNIKNNSILAREYLILSKGANNTDGGLFKSTIKNNTNKNESTPTNIIEPTRLENTKRKVENIQVEFEKRIVRSPNFEQDHVYLVDGKPVDYSVTQKVHGKPDFGDWSTPSTCLGNTADDVSRTYFDNNDSIPDGYSIPNMDESDKETLLKGLNNLRKYFDNKFGKGKYGIITKEFPIGGTVEVNGEMKTIAGTMDLIVYTDSGEIYIFDFKTKRSSKNNPDAMIDDITKQKYSKQVNIYRQLIEENFPEFKGKVHAGGLIRFVVGYSKPNNKVKFREHPTIKNQLQVKLDYMDDFENVQDADPEYNAPYLFTGGFSEEDTFEEDNIINLTDVDYSDPIKALPDNQLPSNELSSANGNSLLEESDEILDEDYEDLDLDAFDDFEDDFGNKRFAETELIETSEKYEGDYPAENNLIATTEIYTADVVKDSTDNAFGIQVVNNLNEFVNTFPTQYRGIIKQILQSNELNYTCQ